MIYGLEDFIFNIWCFVIYSIYCILFKEMTFELAGCEYFMLCLLKHFMDCRTYMTKLVGHSLLNLVLTLKILKLSIQTFFKNPTNL